MNKIIITNRGVEQELDSVLFSENKIIFNKDARLSLSLENYEGSLSIEVQEEISAEVVLFLNNSKVDFTYNIKGDLTLSSFGLNYQGKISISLEKEQAKITLYSASINDQDRKVVTKIKHVVPETISELVQHVVSLKGSTTLEVEGIVPKSSSQCVCKQDNKILNFGTSDCTILPKLLIDNYDVEAAHSAYVGKFSEDELFYLQSRGLDEATCYYLLLKSYLFGKMSLTDEEKELFYPHIPMIKEV